MVEMKPSIHYVQKFRGSIPVRTDSLPCTDHHAFRVTESRAREKKQEREVGPLNSSMRIPPI